MDWDPEAAQEMSLVPGMSKLDNMLRWGFIKKVLALFALHF